MAVEMSAKGLWARFRLLRLTFDYGEHHLSADQLSVSKAHPLLDTYLVLRIPSRCCKQPNIVPPNTYA